MRVAIDIAGTAHVATDDNGCKWIDGMPTEYVATADDIEPGDRVRMSFFGNLKTFLVTPENRSAVVFMADGGCVQLVDPA